MHPLLREAEHQFRLMLVDSYVNGGRVPPMVPLSVRRDASREETEFFVILADDRRIRWRVSDLIFMDAPPVLRSARGLIRALRELWDGLWAERREPPRM